MAGQHTGIQVSNTCKYIQVLINTSTTSPCNNQNHDSSKIINSPLNYCDDL